jgi:hypothetical protein
VAEWAGALAGLGAYAEQQNKQNLELQLLKRKSITGFLTDVVNSDAFPGDFRQRAMQSLFNIQMKSPDKKLSKEEEEEVQNLMLFKHEYDKSGAFKKQQADIQQARQVIGTGPGLGALNLGPPGVTQAPPAATRTGPGLGAINLRPPGGEGVQEPDLRRAATSLAVPPPGQAPQPPMNLFERGAFEKQQAAVAGESEELDMLIDKALSIGLEDPIDIANWIRRQYIQRQPGARPGKLTTVQDDEAILDDQNNIVYKGPLFGKEKEPAQGKLLRTRPGDIFVDEQTGEEVWRHPIQQTTSTARPTESSIKRAEQRETDAKVSKYLGESNTSAEAYRKARASNEPPSVLKRLQELAQGENRSLLKFRDEAVEYARQFVQAYGSAQAAIRAIIANGIRVQPDVMEVLKEMGAKEPRTPSFIRLAPPPEQTTTEQ